MHSSRGSFISYLTDDDVTSSLHHIKIASNVAASPDQCIGACRRWTGIFRELHAYHVYGRQHKLKQPPGTAMLRTDRLERLDVEKECERLVSGFRAQIGTSSLRRDITELKRMLSTPDWMKAPNRAYEQMSGKCSQCQAEFGLLKRRHFCAVCGLAVCTASCSKPQLLIYVPDDISKDEEPDVRWAIIEIVGCPEKEPSCSICVRTCRECEQKLTAVKVRGYEQQASRDLHAEQWRDVISLHEQLARLCSNIDKALPEYRLLIDALESRDKSCGTHHSGRSNVQILAKAQCDLSDSLAKLVSVVSECKRLRAATEGQQRLLKNIISSKVTFYQESVLAFRVYQRALETSTPPAVLEAIQKIVDQNAINSSYLLIKQLGLETLALVSKHSFDDTIPACLAQLEEVVLAELRCCVSDSGESWELHEQCLNEFIRTQIKDHRLIRPSRTLTKIHGVAHIKAALHMRSEIVLQQVQLQLLSKTTDRSFKRSKVVLEETIVLITQPV